MLRRRKIAPETREAILNAWAAGASVKQLGDVSGHCAASAYTVVFQARMAGDPRAVLRTYQRSGPALLASLVDQAQGEAAAGTGGIPDRAGEDRAEGVTK